MLRHCFLQLQKRTKPMQVSCVQVQEIKLNVLFSVWVPSSWCKNMNWSIIIIFSVNSLCYTIVKNDVNVALSIKYFTSLKVHHYGSWDIIISPKSIENSHSSVKCCFIWVILCNVHFPWFWPLTLKWPWVNFIGLSKHAKESPKWNNIWLSYGLLPLILPIDLELTFWKLNWPWVMLAFKYYVNVDPIGPSKKGKRIT